MSAKVLSFNGHQANPDDARQVLALQAERERYAKIVAEITARTADGAKPKYAELSAAVAESLGVIEAHVDEVLWHQIDARTIHLDYEFRVERRGEIQVPEIREREPVIQIEWPLFAF
jgi:hypothetical protein